MKQKDLRKKLRVIFKGEPGIDLGGVSKEWFFLIMQRFFNENYGKCAHSLSIFIPSMTNVSYGLIIKLFMESYWLQQKFSYPGLFWTNLYRRMYKKPRSAAIEVAYKILFTRNKRNCFDYFFGCINAR